MSLYIDSKYIKLVSSRLRNFKQKNSYLWNFSCPICGDSQKNRTKARGYAFQKGNNLFYRCHNCGASTNLGNFLKQVDTSLHREYILERYKAGENGNSNFKDPSFDIPSPKFDKLDKQKVFEHGEWCDKLPAGHFCLEYLERRKIPKEHYKSLLFTNKYRQFVTSIFPNNDKQIVDDARLVIPFYNEYDELIAVSGRALETSDKTLRYVTIRSNESKHKLVFGFDKVNIKEKIKIVEGPIDSLFLNNCLASGDANLSLVANQIESENKVLIFDNEPRNKEIVKMIQDAIKTGYDIVIWPDTVTGKDINEMVMNGKSPGEIEEIISSNTFKGVIAQLKFNLWKKV
jgi:transcription elongation factor Elf1